MRKVIILFGAITVNLFCFSQSHWDTYVSAGTSMNFFKSTPYYGLINSHGQTGNITLHRSFGGLVSAGISYNFHNNYFFVNFSYKFYNLFSRYQYQKTIITNVGMNGTYAYQEILVDKSENNFINNYLIPVQYGYSFKTKKNVIFIPYVGWINEFRKSFREGLYLSKYSGYINAGFKLKYKIFYADLNYAYCLTNFSDLHPDMVPSVVNIIVGITFSLKTTNSK